MGSLSVCICAFNAELHIRKVINQIIEQDCDELLELIIIDDGSTDLTHSICYEIAKKFKKIKLIHQNNKGLGGARNTAIRNCSGKYISFIDSDDEIVSDYMSLLSKHMKNKYDIIVFDYYIKNNKSVKKASSNIRSAPVPSCMWSIEYLISNNFTFVEHSYYEDNAISYFLFHKTDNILKVNKESFYYVYNENSITNKKSRKVVDGRIKSSQEFMRNCEKFNIFNDECLINLVSWYETAISQTFYGFGSYSLLKEVIFEFNKMHNGIDKRVNSKTKKILFLVNNLGFFGYSLVLLTKISKKFK